MANGEVVELDEKAFQHFHRIASELTLQGLRVLAFAYRSAGREFDDIKNYLGDLIFIGFQCMVDPPREESYEAIRKCKEAGVRVVMLTGDHPNTALFIAKEIGIDCNSVVSGYEVEKMNDEGLTEVLRRTNIFARILPEMKLKIVKLLQEMREVVAVTGDGVNDAPALKRADIGVAMGSGTEVAKESAEIVLLDDNFATIVEAIDEGRNVFKKIQKILTWLLPTNVGEGIVVLAAFILGIALPILPLQILWINTVTAVLLGTTLVFESREPNLLRLKPITGGLLNPEILFRIAWVAAVLVLGAYFLYFRYSENEILARTVAMNTIVFFEIFYLLASRSIDLSFVKTFRFKNRAIYIGILATIVLQLLVTYSPYLNMILHTTAISIGIWPEILIISSTVFFLVELGKYVKSKNKNRA